jgi:hypothetical protein
MARMVITHGVVDIDRWLEGKDERAGAVASMGGSNVTDYVAQDGSNAVAVGADVADIETVLAGLASAPPELQDAMERHGVLPPMTVYVEK